MRGAKLGITALASLLAGAPAFASGVAYVDYARLANQAPQAQASRKLVSQEFVPRLHKIRKEQAKVKALREELSSGATGMNMLQQSALRQQLQQAQKRVNQDASQYQTALDLRQSELESNFSALVKHTIAAYAREHHVVLVLKQGARYVGSDANITQAILARLKQDYRKAQAKAAKPKGQ